jgi:inorganic pyrophosphatase
LIIRPASCRARLILSRVALRCLVEIPKGSRNKYEYDEALGGIKLDRFLFSSVVYPADSGFLLDTEGPLRAFVLVEHPTFPGCVIEVRAIAAHGGVVICVPHQDPHWSGLEDVDDIPAQLRREIAHFVAITQEGMDEAGGFEDCDAALALISSRSPG